MDNSRNKTQVYTTSILKLFPGQNDKKLISLYNILNTELSNFNFYEIFYNVEQRSSDFEKKLSSCLTKCMSMVQVYNKKNKQKLSGKQKKLLIKNILSNYVQQYYNKNFHHLKECRDKLRSNLHEILEDIEYEIENVLDQLIDLLKDCMKVTLEIHHEISAWKKLFKECFQMFKNISKKKKKTPTVNF